MRTRSAARLAWSLWATTVALCVTFLVFFALSFRTPASAYGFRGLPAVHALAFATVGALIASRRPHHPLAWLFCGTGLAIAVQQLGFEYGVWAREHAESQTLAAYGAWIVEWLWIVWIFSVGTFGLLLYPDGRLPSPRWRPVAVLAVAGMAALTFGTAFERGPFQNVARHSNPVGLFDKGPLVDIPEAVGIVLSMLAIVLSVASVVVRMRRATSEQRLQLRWFVVAGVVLVLGLATNALEGVLSDQVIGSFVMLGLSAFAVALGIGILRYRALDIDVVVNRAVVYGALAVFITIDYVAIVVGVGAVVGRQGNGVLTALAAALAAITFQPLRRRVSRFANRLVYGKRATPYEVLSEFSERVGGEYAVEDVLPRMARALGEGTGAARAEVRLRVGEELRTSAVWPPEAVPGDAEPDLLVAVRHGAEELGALVVWKARGEAVTPVETRLVEDLAAQAGLVLRNVRLTEELRANLEALRESRQRLVTAQDAERRRLERDIHDGAQQHLVSLMVKIRVLESLARKSPERVGEMLSDLKDQAGAALETLRELARGIYPPLLADQGLPAALEAHARRAPVPVTVHPDGVGRHAQEIEAAVYFCALEALQNVAKYAEASRVDLTLRQSERHLEFEVRDDGRGFDPASTPPGSGLVNMRDRLEALGGTIEIRSEPGAGTRVTGRVPVAQSPEAAVQASSSRSGSNSDLGM